METLLLHFLCFLSTIAVGCGWENTNFFGVTQVAIVVPSLEEAKQWYTETLGGAFVPKLSETDGVFGNSHHNRMFSREILRSARSGETLDSLGVPDISDNGTWKMRWNMIMFGNFMVQLIQFVGRQNPNTVWDSVHPDGDGAAKVTTQHIAFWLDDTVNITDYVVQMRQASGYNGPNLASGPYRSQNPSRYLNRMVFNSGSQVSDRIQQYQQPVADVIAIGNILSGAGPQKERVEWGYSGTEPRREEHVHQFCTNKASAPQIMDPGTFKPGRGTTQSLFGLHHVGVITDDLAMSKRFYQILGSKPAFPTKILPVFNWFWYEFQDDVLNAQERGFTDLTSYGIVNLNQAPNEQVLEFMAFENAYVELNEFQQNQSGIVTPVHLNWNSRSPAYLDSMTMGIGIKDNVGLADVMTNIQRTALAAGMTKVKAPSVDSSELFPAGDLQGYDYAVMSGPSDENIMLVSYKGRARAALKEAMDQYGAVSSRFASTDIWKRNGFSSSYCCSKFQMCDVGRSSPDTGYPQPPTNPRPWRPGSWHSGSWNSRPWNGGSSNSGYWPSRFWHHGRFRPGGNSGRGSWSGWQRPRRPRPWRQWY